MKKAKKSIKPSTNNNKKEAATKSKQALNKSVERRAKGGLNLTTESNKNSSIDARNDKDKIKPTVKDGRDKRSASVSHRTKKSNNEVKEKGGDFLYDAMYKANIDNNKGYSIENISKPDSQKIQKDKDIFISKEKPISQPAGGQFEISVERTDDIHYDIGDKKIHSNINKSYKYDYKANNDRKGSEDSTQKKYNETQNKKSNYNSSSNYERPSTSTYSSRTPGNFANERTVDLFVIDTDDGEEPLISSKYKKKIDRTRNKIKEIKIEKYDSKTPIRDEKLTGFVLIRKSKGKKIYDVEFEDNIDKINEILKNKKVMIKNEIIQFVTLTKLSNYDRDIKNYTDKISRLQNDLNKKDYSKPRESVNSNNAYEVQISSLKAKNQELNKIIFQQQEELDENIREFKQVKLAYDQLKDSIEREKIEREKMEKEKEREREQQIKEEPSKIKKKAAQMQLDEDNDQKAIKEMKMRIRKYKDVLKNPDEKNKIPFTYRQDDPSLKGNQSPTKKRHKATIENAQNKDSQQTAQEQSQNQDEDEDDDIGEYVLGDEDSKDPKKRKMKNAVNRFRKKYYEVIKEEKKIQKEKEKEEKEREENEERELEDENYQEEKEREEREREEKERREREEKERKEKEELERRERERKEREERERKEREERERKEREEKERKERERKEREKKEREERERKERERKEREKRDKEEKERKERERKEREKRDREEKEKREKKDSKPAMGGGRVGGGKIGVNFSKMLAEKLKMAPPGAMKKGVGAPKVDSKPPIVEKNVDMAKLLENQPFQGRKDKKKPTRKVFVLEDDNED